MSLRSLLAQDVVAITVIVENFQTLPQSCFLGTVGHGADFIAQSPNLTHTQMSEHARTRHHAIRLPPSDVPATHVDPHCTIIISEQRLRPTFDPCCSWVGVWADSEYTILCPMQTCSHAPFGLFALQVMLKLVQLCSYYTRCTNVDGRIFVERSLCTCEATVIDRLVKYVFFLDHPLP